MCVVFTSQSKIGFFCKSKVTVSHLSRTLASRTHCANDAPIPIDPLRYLGALRQWVRDAVDALRLLARCAMGSGGTGWGWPLDAGGAGAKNVYPASNFSFFQRSQLTS